MTAIAPRIRGALPLRVAFLVSGIATCAAGIDSIYEARLGLAPWDVLNQGLAKHTPLSFGTANIAVAIAILVLARDLGVRVRPGTVANAIGIGAFVDVFLRLNAVQHLQHHSLEARVPLLAFGIVLTGIGSAMYLGAAMGAGPRDSLMLGLTVRTGRRVGLVRTGLEVSATAAGFALGGTVGVGTVAFAVGIGPVIEVAFGLLRRSPLSVREPRAAATGVATALEAG
jgi:uncharacterized membrane protein YczE